VAEDSSRKKLLLAALAAIVALVAVSFLIANLKYAGEWGEGQSIRQFTDRLAAVISQSLYALWLLIMLYYIYILLTRRKGVRIKDSRRMSRPSPLGVFLALLLLASMIVAIRFADLHFFLGGGGDGGGDGGGGTPSAPSDPFSSESGTLWFLIFLLILTVFFGVMYLRRWRTISLAEYGTSSAEREEEAKRTIERAIRELYAGDDFRSVIIRTYQQMCLLLVNSPIKNERFLTPRELAALIVARLGWPEMPVEELTGLFEEAKYSDHPMDEEGKEKAIRCLTEIRETLEKGAGEIGRGEAVPA